MLQVRAADAPRVALALRKRLVGDRARRRPASTPTTASSSAATRRLLHFDDEERTALRALWSTPPGACSALRDDPACADEEHALRTDAPSPA